MFKVGDEIISIKTKRVIKLTEGLALWANSRRRHQVFILKSIYESPLYQLLNKKEDNGEENEEA